MTEQGPILRVFEVRTKPGAADQLLQNFSSTSAGVVQGQPGNQGYFFGRCVQGGANAVLFVSVWKDLEAVKERFGDDWQTSYLPAGYEDFIEECSIRHFNMAGGWHVDMP
ncbi:MAG: antibiotic biosynthesis monooxygenase [Pseudomonadota bacterium]